MIPIPEFPGYFVKPNGIILGKQGIALKPAQTLDGYCFVGLCLNGKTYNRYVHRLVAQAYLGLDIENSLIHINHLDRIKSHNSFDNLELCDTAYNTRYSRQAKYPFDSDTHKQCRRCKIVKPHSNFGGAKTTDGLRCWCTQCGNEYSRQKRNIK